MVTPEERGFREMLRKRGRDLKHLDSGAKFRGTINRVGEFDLAGDFLGKDPRGMRVLEISATNPPPLSSQDKILDLASNETFTVTDLKFDCPVYSKKYALKQDSANDQP